VLSPKFEKVPAPGQDFNTHSLSFDAVAPPVKNDRTDAVNSQHTAVTPSGVKMSPSYERTCLIGKMDTNQQKDNFTNIKIAKVLDYDETEPDVQSQHSTDTIPCHGRLESRSISPRIMSHSSSSSADSIQTVISANFGSVSNSPKTPGLFGEVKADELSRDLQKAKMNDLTEDEKFGQDALGDKNSERATFYIGDESDNEDEDENGLVKNGDFADNGTGKDISQNGAEVSQTCADVPQKNSDTHTGNIANNVFNHANVASLEKPELAENGVYKIRNRVVENRVVDTIKDQRNSLPTEGVAKGFKKSTSLLQSLMKEKASNQVSLPLCHVCDHLERGSHRVWKSLENGILATLFQALKNKIFHKMS
jgi:hypothetical protein